MGEGPGRAGISPATSGTRRMRWPTSSSARRTIARPLQIQKADFTVSSVIDKINRNKVNLRPSYQREYVWTVRTASKLVESLMLCMPIPTMFFHEVGAGGLEVVDGKQRLTSIWSFIQGEFPDGTKFALKGLDVFAEHNGKTFDELPPELQERILDHPLNVHTISRQSQPDFVFEVFERLNMGATQLNEQELRNCIYQGVYTDLLCDLAGNEHLLGVCRSKQPHLRMKDRELILRFFAMQRTNPAGMTSPIKAWLNEEIRENKDMTPQEADEMREVFQETIRLVWEVFGDCAFRPVKKSVVEAAPSESDLSGIFYRDYFENGEVNVALWDTVMHAFAGRTEEEVLPHQRTNPRRVHQTRRGRDVQEVARVATQGGGGEGGRVGDGDGQHLWTQGGQARRQSALRMTGTRGRSSRSVR